jgi:hypothetical protein
MSGGRRPLQNRVTPFGDVVAIAQRGLFIGNRGIIHDPATKTLLGRRWTTKAWLVCVLDYKGRHREVMGGRSWTELFFLDEAVALAAGHRPCFFCRRAAAEAFRTAWGKAGTAGNPHAAFDVEGAGNVQANSPIDRNSLRRVLSSLWSRQSARSTAAASRSSSPDCCNGAHPMPQTGYAMSSLRNTARLDPGT